jgi:hypothetical protein
MSQSGRLTRHNLGRPFQSSTLHHKSMFPKHGWIISTTFPLAHSRYLSGRDIEEDQAKLLAVLKCRHSLGLVLQVSGEAVAAIFWAALCSSLPLSLFEVARSNMNTTVNVLILGRPLSIHYAGGEAPHGAQSIIATPITCTRLEPATSRT